MSSPHSLVEKTLKDWGIDWILEERGDKFEDLMYELKLAIVKLVSR